VERAIMAGDAETGVTIHETVEELDAGPVAAQEAFPIGPRTTRRRLRARGRGARAAARRRARRSAPRSGRRRASRTYAEKIGRRTGGSISRGRPQSSSGSSGR
jgi:methionyl-tRNA formyltransferase